MGWLIKVGDRFSLNNENWEVIFIDNESVAIARSENGEGRVVSQRTIYKNWYEQQKQRADELEKSLNLSILASNNDALVTELQMALSESNERADELEKRWSELRERLIKTCKSDRTVAKQYSRSFLCLLDELEGKENVFETLQKLDKEK